jgi:hypothetical protein
VSLIRSEAEAHAKVQLLLAAKATAEAAARDAEEAAAVEAAAQEAVVTAALMYDAAVADAQLAEEPAGVAEAAAIKAAASEQKSAEVAAAEAASSRERCMQAAVQAAVQAHGLEQHVAEAQLSAQRARGRLKDTEAQLERLRHQKQQQQQQQQQQQREAFDGAGCLRLTPLPFDPAALKAVEEAGPLLPAAQLPGAVAAVLASLRAANESGVAALEARLEAARQRRVASEAERDAMHARVAPLRSLVPTVSTDELLARLQVEVSKRQQLEVEFRVIKGHIEEVGSRLAHVHQQQQQRQKQQQQLLQVKPVQQRYLSALGAGPLPKLAEAQLLAPVQMEAAVNALGKTAARLKEKIAPEAAEEA